MVLLIIFSMDWYHLSSCIIHCQQIVGSFNFVDYTRRIA